MSQGLIVRTWCAPFPYTTGEKKTRLGGGGAIKTVHGGRDLEHYKVLPFLPFSPVYQFIATGDLQKGWFSLWPNNNGLVASLALSQNQGENNIAFWRCQVAARSLPACLTPESSSDGYSDSSFGGGQLAGAQRHMVTSPLPKKPSPCARNLANQCWLLRPAFPGEDKWAPAGTVVCSASSSPL